MERKIVLGLLVVVMEQIIVRFSLNVAPEALKLTAAEYIARLKTSWERYRPTVIPIHIQNR